MISSRRLAFACPCVSVASAITASSSSGGGTAGAGAGVGAAGVGAAAGDSATLWRVSYRWVGAGAVAEASEATGAEAICSSDARKTQPTWGSTMRACFPFVAVTSTDVP